MSKSLKIELNGETEIEFGGSVGPDGVEDLYVGVIIKGTSISIEDLLNQKQRTYFEDLLIFEAIDRADHAKEEAEERKFEQMRDDRLSR